MAEDDPRAHHCLTKLGEHLIVSGYVKAVAKSGLSSSGITDESEPFIDLQLRLEHELIVFGALLLCAYTKKFFRRKKLLGDEFDHIAWIRFCGSLERKLDAWTDKAQLSKVLRRYMEKMGPTFMISGAQSNTAGACLDRRLKAVFREFQGTRCPVTLCYAVPNALSPVVAEIAEKEFAD